MSSSELFLSRVLNGKTAVQFEEPSDDARPDEDSKMEVDDEAVRSNQFDVRKKEIIKDTQKMLG